MNSLSFVERLSPSQRYERLGREVVPFSEVVIITEQLVLCGGAVCPLLRGNKLVGQSFHTL